MLELRGQDTISGKEGTAYVKIDGENKELFFAKSIEATVDKTKSEIKAIGKRMVGHKTTGASGSGTMTLFYLSPIFRDMIKTWKSTGKDVYFDMVLKNEDEESDAGEQSILLIDCNIDSVALAKLDGDSDDPLDEEVPFTFEDFDILTPFTEIE